MHVVQHPRRQIVQRRMYSPYNRMVVNGVGLGSNSVRYNYDNIGLSGLDGSILQNISRVMGGITATIATGGLIWLAPKKTRISVERITGAMVTSGGIGASIAPNAWGLSKSEANITRGITAAAAVVAGGIYLAPLMASGSSLIGVGGGAIGTASSGSSVIGAATGQVVASTGGGLLSTIGSGLQTVGSGLWTVAKGLLPNLLQMGAGLMTGGGGGVQPQQQQQQGGMTQAEFDAAQQAAAQEGARQQQEAYRNQMALQQSQMPISNGMMYGEPIGQTMNTSYGDLRSPYTAITEDGQQVQVDPNTGQVIPEGMSTTTKVMLGGVVLLAGWYFMSGSKANN
jgi:hypothetical protein